MPSTRHVDDAQCDRERQPDEPVRDAGVRERGWEWHDTCAQARTMKTGARPEDYRETNSVDKINADS
jgi:hypothetical protein